MASGLTRCSGMWNTLPLHGTLAVPTFGSQEVPATTPGGPVGVLRLAHVDVRTPDLELSTAYYTEVLGLHVSDRTDDAVYLKCWDEEDHHSLRLRYAPQVGMDLMSFKVHHEDDLADLENRVARYGLPVERISRGEAMG